MRVRAEGGAAIVEVLDEGPGIAPAERERVFERFRRGEGAAGAGSGLGLAIVREIATRHGATVELADRATGPGLCARLGFRRGQPRA